VNPLKLIILFWKISYKEDLYLRGRKKLFRCLVGFEFLEMCTLGRTLVVAIGINGDH